jgi:Kae1-associated kinase Bud32
MEKIISQGAEAEIILSNNFIIKDRKKKDYRIPELDLKIRSRRTRSEMKLLLKASEVINCPKLLMKSNTIKDSSKIKMSFIKGKRLSENLNKFSLKKQKEILEKIGEEISKLHDVNIIHGDLTTSNMIFSRDKIFFVDFGLGFFSRKEEDKAVDLHLLKEALEAKHFESWEELFDCFLKGYGKSKNFNEVIKRLEKVEKRGRYKVKKVL